MSRAFQYKPKFVDIRVRPPKAGDDAPPDVNALKPGERPCDFAGCRLPATAKAPKSREMMNEHYWFCMGHAAEYNRRWDFFAGLSEDQIRIQRETESLTGGRPTWSFKASNRSREAAAAATANGPAGWGDPFGVFSASERRAAQAKAERSARPIGKLERAALADLDLDGYTEPAAIRARYTELVKRCHPDANGGDRSAEHKLQRVIKAYKSLRKAGLA
jgi:hypothetical protein